MAGALEKWQARYRSASPDQVREPDPLLVHAAHLLPPGHALDLACGAGRHALFLASSGWTVTAIDGAPAALDLFAAPGIEKLCLDLATTPVSLASDLAVCTLYLDRALWPRLRSQARAVAFVLPTADPDPQVAPMNPAYLVEPGELEAAFTGWQVRRSALRKQPGTRQLVEFLALRTNTSPSAR